MILDDLRGSHLGQFPQDGENGQNVAFFHNFWSSAVTKWFDRLNFSQLFWRDFAGLILKIFVKKNDFFGLVILAVLPPKQQLLAYFVVGLQPY